MKVSITNVDAMEVQDTSVCDISNTQKIHAYKFSYYKGSNNRAEYIDSCHNVEFSSPFAVYAHRSSDYVFVHGQRTTKVYNVIF
jgi:hypothetical protein